jgi:hypothetical protein
MQKRKRRNRQSTEIRKKMRSESLLLCSMLCFIPIVFSQNKINFSPEYFGPNALPVYEISDARIPKETQFRASGNYFFGFGDRTTSLDFKVIIPLLPERVSFEATHLAVEFWEVTQEVYDYRSMMGDKLKGFAWGEIFCQTNVSLIKERANIPTFVLSGGFKTATGTGFMQRRNYDSPGYFFTLEIGHSYYPKHRFLEEFRMVGYLGFLCWQTTTNAQNDAFTYGGKFVLRNRLFDFQNGLSGYSGWIANGDTPLVFSSRLTWKRTKCMLFIEYQYGIHDFPYQNIRLGCSLKFPSLTPRLTE